MMEWKKLMSKERMYSNLKTKENDPRSPFEKDFNRVLFSSHFRSLQGKTQVFPMPTNDIIHNRLTHSLEVARVGESLGRLAGDFILNIDENLNSNFSKEDFGNVISAACLAHDIGNPPFGHSGESAMSEFFKKIDLDMYLNYHHLKHEHINTPEQWQDLLHIEGNATGLRTVIRKDFYGFDLTFATLGTFCKYPWKSSIENTDNFFDSLCPNMVKKITSKKYGFYQSESLKFEEIANKLGLKKLNPDQKIWCRHPLAFLVEAADDICYRLIDFEDGITKNILDFDSAEKLLKTIVKSNYDVNFYNALRKSQKIGYLRGKAIFNLIYEVIEIFKQRYDGIMNGTYCGDLIGEIPSYNVLKDIKDNHVAKHVYSNQSVLELEIAGFEVLEYLMKSFIDAVEDCEDCNTALKLNKKVKQLIPEEYLLAPHGEDSSYNRIINIIEFISGMTDNQAAKLYRRLKGIEIPF